MAKLKYAKNMQRFLSKYWEIYVCHFPAAEWSFLFPLDIPKQKKNFDCGVYTCISLQSVAVIGLLNARYYITMMALEITPE